VSTAVGQSLLIKMRKRYDRRQIEYYHLKDKALRARADSLHVSQKTLRRKPSVNSVAFGTLQSQFPATRLTELSNNNGLLITLSPQRCSCRRNGIKLNQTETRMWANAQPDGRPAEHRWRPLFNAAKFG